MSLAHMTRTHRWASDVDTEDLVTVMLISVRCEFQILLASDPTLSRAETVQTIQERCCDTIIAAMQTACPSTANTDDSGLRVQDKRYWLTFNATVTAAAVCQKLLSCGYASSCVQLALFCCAALESSVPLLQPAYLPWRARWYGIVCNAYHRSGSASDGVTYAKRAVQQIQSVASAIALDPVKPTAEMQQALVASETEAVALLVALSCCHGSSDITATLSDAKASSWPSSQKFSALLSAALQGAPRLDVALASARDGDDRPADTGAGKCLEAAYEAAKPALLEMFRHYEDAANAAAEAKPEVKAASQAVCCKHFTHSKQFFCAHYCRCFALASLMHCRRYLSPKQSHSPKQPTRCAASIPSERSPHPAACVSLKSSSGTRSMPQTSPTQLRFTRWRGRSCRVTKRWRTRRR